jgi:hypothetical protein
VTTIAIFAGIFACFVWLLAIGANLTHNPDLVERDNPNQ